MKLLQRRLLTLGLLALTTALAVFSVTFHDKKMVQYTEDQQQASRFVQLASTDVVGIELQTTKKTFQLKRQGEGEQAWQIISPLQIPGDSTVINALIDSATDLHFKFRLGAQNQNDDFSKDLPPPTDLKPFGLQPARFTLKLVDHNQQTHVIAVGKENSFNGMFYAQRFPQKDVGLISASFEGQLSKDLFALREKRPVVFESNNLQQIQLTSLRHHSFFVINQKATDGSYWLHSTALAEAVKADEGQMQSLLSTLSSLRSKTVLTEAIEGPEGLKAYGMEHPAVKAQLHFHTGAPVTLLFSVIEDALDSNAFRYLVMKEGDKQPVFEMSSDWAHKQLDIEVHDLRDMHIAPFDADQAHRIVIAHNDTTLKLVRNIKDKEDAGTWHIDGEDPQHGEKIESYKVSAMLSKLANLKANKFIHERATDKELEDYGIMQAQTKVSIFANDEDVIHHYLLGHIENDLQALTTEDNKQLLSWVALEDLKAISPLASSFQEPKEDEQAMGNN